jgi:hypothetical protein
LHPIFGIRYTTNTSAMAQSLDLQLDPRVRAFVTDALTRIKPELDGVHCREHGIRFDNHEIPAELKLDEKVMEKAVEL